MNSILNKILGTDPFRFRPFILSAGCILLITGLAKIISAFGKAEILNYNDPLFGISFKHLMLLVGIIELVISAICLLCKWARLQVGLLALLATNLWAYRIGLLCVGYHRPCSCMGNLTDVLHVSPWVADSMMKTVLAYLLIGSYGALFWTWVGNQNRNAQALPNGK
jgi:hypothetical protein